MIRRDIRLADGSAAWMLISQLEHARVSAALAMLGRGSSPLDFGAEGGDLLAAIFHHDDGWEIWERAPQLDPETGRPLSFAEVAAEEAIAIWSRSIDAAASRTPLMAWLVAGHFLRLAGHATGAKSHAAVVAWRQEIENRRAEWFADWQSARPERRTAELAQLALDWLRALDEASLWLCCSCGGEHAIPCAPEPCCVGRGGDLEMTLQVTGDATATAVPWRFCVPSVEVSIAGRVVPAKRYQNPEELLATAVPHAISWRLAAN